MSSKLTLPARALVACLLATASSASLGCGSSGGLPTKGNMPHGEMGKPANIKDEEFAASLFSLLRDGAPTPARDARLVGVVRRQLAHAATRFAHGYPERATDSVIGAMYLMRAGEGRAEMIDEQGDRALAGAITRLSSLGDEGRALALMQMRASFLPAGSPQRKELDEHLRALGVWMKDTRTGKAIRKAGAEERALVSRALVDPSREALDAAARSVSTWIDGAIDFHNEFRQTGERPVREDAIEAARALESGGITMAALFLRHGDARGAVERISGSSAKRLIPPQFMMRLGSAATDDGASDWQAVAGAFAQLESEPQDMETGTDPALVSAALWGSTLEAFRRAPSHFGAAMLVARSLIRFGMSEAAPLALAEGLGAEPDARALATAMDLVVSALNEDASIDDIEAVRRTFRAAAPVLAHGDKPKVASLIEPSAAQVRFMMASIEVRAGNLAAARPLLAAALTAEPSVSGYTMFAMVERQAGDPKKAIEHVGKALGAPDARFAVLDVAEALILSFEVHRDAGAKDKAKETLDRALDAVLAARKAGTGPADKARAERLLGRVLDGYGDVKGAGRALDRALVAAAAERPILGATVLDAVGRAFVRRDLPAARAALKRGIEADVPEEDLVYGGLWVLLLERELRAPTDGTAERALRGGDRGSWVAKLSLWANGKLSDAELASSAQNAAQRVEAAFYAAMAKKVAGDPGAEESLRQVAKSPVIDLLEVHLAREMLAPQLSAELPGGVKLP